MADKLVKFLGEIFRGNYADLPSPIDEDGAFAIVLDMDNQVMIATGGLWMPVYNSKPSSKLLACVPAHDAATRFTDVTGNANHLLVEASNTNAFNNDGYATTTAAGSGATGLNIPQSAIKWNPLTESLLLSFAMKKAAPGANENVLSLGATVAGNQGFYLSHRTTGIFKFVPILNTGSAGSNVDSTLSFSDSTPKDRVCVVAIDAPTGSVYMWRDGILTVSSVGLMTGANAYSNAVSNAEFRIGSLGAAANSAVVASLTRGIQLAKFQGSLPTNIGLIAARLAETPSIPLSAMEW